MKKIIKVFAILFALISTTYAVTPISDKEIKEIQNLELFQKAQIIVKSAYDAKSLYLLNVSVRGNSEQIYLSKDKKYLIAGDVISIKDGTLLEIPVDIKPTLGKEAFTFGKGKDEYILFTDPECPYCKEFESYFSQIEDKVKIRVFFFPLNIHKDAKDISLYIMSQKSYEAKIKAMLSTTKDTPAFINRKISKNELEKLQKSLDEQMAIANELGIGGTPALFDTKGERVNWIKMLQEYGVEIKDR